MTRWEHGRLPKSIKNHERHQWLLCEQPGCRPSSGSLTALQHTRQAPSLAAQAAWLWAIRWGCLTAAAMEARASCWRGPLEVYRCVLPCFCISLHGTGRCCQLQLPSGLKVEASCYLQLLTSHATCSNPSRILSKAPAQATLPDALKGFVTHKCHCRYAPAQVTLPHANQGVVTHQRNCPALKAAVQPQATPAGRSNGASRARPGMHRRSGSLDAVALNTGSGGPQSLASPPNPSRIAASSAQDAARGADARQLGARAGRGSLATGAGEPRRRAPAASKRTENDENAGPDRSALSCLWLQQDRSPYMQVTLEKRPVLA